MIIGAADQRRSGRAWTTVRCSRLMAGAKRSASVGMPWFGYSYDAHLSISFF
jgi:hypothetical protein